MHAIYHPLILEHAANPRNWGALAPSDIDYQVDNPSCGDQLRLTLRLNASGSIVAVGWEGQACAVSVASASLLGERLRGQTLDEAARIDQQTLLELFGAPVAHSRLRCALLPLNALITALLGPEEAARRMAESDD